MSEEARSETAEEPATTVAPEKEPWFPACDWKGAVILTLGVLLLALTHYSTFRWLDGPYRLFGWFGLNVVLLLIVPLLLIRFVFKERVADYGFQLGDARLWGKYLGLFLLVFIPCAMIASRMPSFANYYPRYTYARANHLLMIPASLGWLAYFASWEFFFRGFMLQGLGKRLGPIAIFIQMVPFAMAHFSKLEPEALASIVAGIALGLMAWRSKSFVGPWLLHWAAATTMDLFVVFWPLK